MISRETTITAGPSMSPSGTLRTATYSPDELVLTINGRPTTGTAMPRHYARKADLWFLITAATHAGAAHPLALLDQLPGAVVLLDPTGRIVHLNGIAEHIELGGDAQSDLIARGHEALHPPGRTIGD